ncbi:54S ribosomal protein YmL6, mitochondrial [[Candida] jaroonii]|uniref:54S ribosomal protein YmL6, mitochondrial n=1 Tax=[Candida] jaroonii TaxID=467808 RepID=A0ACA9YFF7_9ASCO|nr:54S ribosomal protein YmL6, mitochondrial [[Candida] jaroonii]
MFKSFVRSLATNANTQVFKLQEPPKYVLGSLRSFPSLEPKEFVALPNDFLNLPTRRDILWSAVVYEEDKAKIETTQVFTKGDAIYSHKKLRPQKGSGKARVGDANSPHRYNPIKAHVITAPHDWSTELPNKIYNKAMATALSEQYKDGKLYIVGNNESSELNESDSSIIDFKYGYPETIKQFKNQHHLKNLNLLFITDIERSNLTKAIEGDKVKALTKENVEVRDILKANRVYIELPALQWFIGKYL